MDRERLTTTHETALNHQLFDYFASTLDEDRLEALLNTGERLINFDFEATTPLSVHHNLLPKNYYQAGVSTPATAYKASGLITYTNETPSFSLHLASTQGETLHACTIEGAADSETTYIYSDNPVHIGELTIQEFGDLSLRSAGIIPSRVRRERRKRGETTLLNDPISIYNFWCELALAKNGAFVSTSHITQTLNSDDNQIIEARFAVRERESEHVMARDMTIEHAIQIPQLDAEIVHRLELSYLSDVSHTQITDADKRVISGCDRQLVNARLVSKDKHGTITPLTMNDATIKQFQTTLELLLQSVD